MLATKELSESNRGERASIGVGYNVREVYCAAVSPILHECQSSRSSEWSVHAYSNGWNSYSH